MQTKQQIIQAAKPQYKRDKLTMGQQSKERYQAASYTQKET